MEMDMESLDPIKSEMAVNCDECEQTFDSDGRLDDHMKMVHVDICYKSQYYFSCEFWAKTFPSKRKDSFEKHRRIHTGEKPYLCHLCDYKCSDKSALISHKKTHDNKKDDGQRFPCEVCGKNIKTLKYLKEHLKLHTAGPIRDRKTSKTVILNFVLKHGEEEARKKFNVDLDDSTEWKKALLSLIICDLCGKGFPDEDILNKHRKIHEDKKRRSAVNKKTKSLVKNASKINDDSFKAEVVAIALSESTKAANKQFGIPSSTIKEWIQLETNPRSCQICSKFFPYDSKLEKHMQQAHGPNKVEFMEQEIYQNQSVSQINASSENSNSFEGYSGQNQNQETIIGDNLDVEKGIHVDKMPRFDQTYYNYIADKSKGHNSGNENYDAFNRLETETNNVRADDTDNLSKDDIIQTPTELTTHKLKEFINKESSSEFQIGKLEVNSLMEKRKYAFFCEVCEKGFTKKSHLMRHTVIHTGLKTFSCTFCPFKSAYKHDIARHIKNLHSDNLDKNTKNTCTFCGKHFSNPATVEKHVLFTHGEVKDFTEEVEDLPAEVESFVEDLTVIKPDSEDINKVTIKDEVSECSGDEITEKESPIAKKKNWFCDFCGKDFKKQQRLKRHMTKHTGIKQFQCHLCPAMFAYKHDIPRHIKSKHCENGRDAVCSFCGKGFTQISHLKSHMRNIHENEVNFKTEEMMKKKRANYKEFECEICGTNFEKKIYLKRHLSIHTDREKFSCQYCPTLFSYKHDMQRHVKSQHSEK